MPRMKLSCLAIRIVKDSSLICNPFKCLMIVKSYLLGIFGSFLRFLHRYEEVQLSRLE